MNPKKNSSFIYGGMIAGFASLSNAYSIKKGINFDSGALSVLADYFSLALYGGLGGALIGGIIEGVYKGCQRATDFVSNIKKSVKSKKNKLEREVASV